MQRFHSSQDFFASAEARRFARLCGLLLLIAAIAVNLRSLGFGFLYLRDDDVNVTLNPHLGAPSLERIEWMFTDQSYVRRYIPLGWLNFSLTYGAAGLNPAAYHAVGVALLGLNGLLVYAILLSVLRSLVPCGRDTGLGTWEVGAACLATGWWALHPLRVETTAWISGNLYGQSAAFLLVSVLAYLRTYGLSGGRRTLLLVASGAAFAASLVTYPLALGVPFLLVGLDYLQTRRQPAAFRALLEEKLIFAVPLAVVAAVTIAARFGNTAFSGAVPGFRDLPLSSRVAQSCYVAAYYLWKPWWPFHLSPLYDTLFDIHPHSAKFLVCILGVGAVSVAALAAFRRRPAFAVVWFGYLAAAAPFFGLTEKPHMASDRYGYLLTVFAAALLAIGLSRLTAPRARFWTAGAAVALIVFLSRLTCRQLDVWSDDRYQHAYVVRRITNPELLDDFTSRQLILDFLRGDEGPAEKAIAEHLARNPGSQGFRKDAAIVADKKRVGAYYGPVPFLAILQDRLALRFADAGELREANDHFEEALRIDDRFYQAAFDRSLVLLKLGRVESALRSFSWAQGQAPHGIPETQRREFLGRLEEAARSSGNPSLARAAAAARAR